VEIKVLVAIQPMGTALATKEAGESKAAFGRSDSYSVWLKVSAVVALIWLLFFDVLVDMAHDWWIEPAWSQGMLLPPLALYIAWAHRSQTFGLVAAPDARGLLLTTLACLMFLLGKLASEDFTTRISFVILLAGLIWTFWGIQRLRTLAFPILLLACMVPLPVMLYNSVAAPLQLLASDIASQIAQAGGVSVFRDGNIIQLAGVSLGVEEACSGLNSLSALSVGGLLFGYLLCSRLLSRIILFVAAIPLAIGINILRVAGTAVLADYNQEFAMGFYHLFSGWLVFVAGAGILYLFARVLHVLADPK
jgi:exosortase